MRARWIATAVLATTACSAPAIPWDDLTNPLLTRDPAVKDAFAVRADDAWHLGYSAIDESPFRFRLGLSTTTDWQSFTHAPSLDQRDTGGLASPDVVQAPDGRWILTYNSHTRDVGDAASKLYFRTSADLITWSAPERIHIDGADAPDERLIDAALAFTDDAGAYLFFKRDQLAYVAHAPSGRVEGPWSLLGAMAPANVENVQALRIDGTWHLIATTIPLIHDPVLLRLAGDPADPAAWLTWTTVRTLAVPEEAWNSGDTRVDYERANAAYLIDARADDGWFYLLYAGSTEVRRFDGRGHSSLGLARSLDLLRWETP